MVGLLGRARLLAALRPEVVEGAAWLLAAWDHVAFRLTGVAAASLQDPAEAITAEEARAAGLDERIAPPAARAGTRHRPAAGQGRRPSWASRWTCRSWRAPTTRSRRSSAPG